MPAQLAHRARSWFDSACYARRACGPGPAVAVRPLWFRVLRARSDSTQRAFLWAASVAARDSVDPSRWNCPPRCGWRRACALAERERLVVPLTFSADREAPRFAADLGVSPGAVRHRAIARLRDCVVERATMKAPGCEPTRWRSSPYAGAASSDIRLGVWRCTSSHQPIVAAAQQALKAARSPWALVAHTSDEDGLEWCCSVGIQ